LLFFGVKVVTEQVTIKIFPKLPEEGIQIALCLAPWLQSENVSEVERITQPYAAQVLLTHNFRVTVKQIADKHKAAEESIEHMVIEFTVSRLSQLGPGRLKIKAHDAAA
jgi:hypothetical protein